MNLNFSSLIVTLLLIFSINSNASEHQTKDINAPALSYVSHQIDDDNEGTSSGNGDGQPEGGELIEMPVSVINNGDQTATNVSATLFCADPDIDVTDDSENIGDIGPGETAWTANDFDFEISPTCPEKDLMFTITFNADEGVWQENFTVHVFANPNPPLLQYADHLIDDDNNGESSGDGDSQVEAGESIELTLAIINSGGTTAHNVTAILSCSDPDISIQDDEEFFGSVSEGQIDWCNNDFDFDVAPTCPEKDVVFSLNIIADEGSWSSDFSIHIFEAGLPELAFNNFIIDDDDNNDSDGDGDGIPESGESIELPLSLINTGEALASNVTATLSCSDPDIDVTDASESFSDIAVGEEVWSNFNFNFDINPTCPDKTVQFVLNINSDEGSWTNSFEIDITHPGSPSLQYSNHIIDDDEVGSSTGDGDGIPEAGEVVEIPIQLINTGIITATGVSASISTSDPDIVIVDAFEYFPDINPGSAIWCVNDYDIEISANCPDKDVIFNITIASNEGSWTDTFIIHISEQGMPQLSFDDFIIDDDSDGNSSGNGNGMAEPGEHIELPVLIQNIGEGDAHNVSAVLSSNDPFINIVDANENYGTISTGDSDWSNNEFDFIVAPNCPDKDVVFTLSINSDEGSWTSNFTLHIHITGTPNLVYTNHSIDDDTNGTSSGDGDGQAEPGENIEMPLAISNIGSAPVNNVVALISCADPDIIITDDSENFGSILAGETQWSNLDFDFTVSYGTPEKDVVFNLVIQSDEGLWNDTFVLHIYPSSGNADLIYLDHSIDDDDDGFSNGNGDGIPSAGESIEMPVLIANSGNTAAHNISALLSCNDPDINITDNSESFVDLNSGEQAWSNYAFDFEIDSDCPDKIVTFSLQINSDEGNFTQNFTQQIVGAGSPLLVFTSYVIDDDTNGESSGDGDGLVEPDESIELPVLVSNMGDGPVHNVYGTLTTNDPDIIMDDGTESFGDITEGSSAWCNNDFGFTVSEDCPEKDVVFSLLLEGDEGSWNVNFSVHITPLIYYTVDTYSSPTNGGTTNGGGDYLAGESCSVNAQAADGYSFVNWTNQGTVVSISPTYTFDVFENTALIAHFSLNEYVVNVNASPSSGGNVDGGGVYQYGETAVVTATPNADYTFVEWTIDGDIVSSNATYSFEVQNDVDLVAHFQGEMYIIDLIANPVDGGVVSGGGEFSYGDIATVLASPTGAYDFVNWTENGTVVSNNTTYSFEVTSNRDLVANFTEDTYIISAVSVPGGAASITGSGPYAYGQYCTVEAIPNGGYYFIEWQEGGNTVSVNSSYNFQVTEDRNLEAHLGVFDYEITTLASPEEAGTVTGGGNFNYGDMVTVNASSNTGWEFLSWTFNGQVMSNDANFTFSVTESMDLQANFLANEYLISAISDPGSGGNIEGEGIYEHGETATLVASPANAYNFINWTEDGDVVSQDLSFSFTVTGERSFIAHFQVQQFEITAIADPAYGGSIIGAGVYDYGSTVTLSANANTNYEFIAWIEDGGVVSTNSNYSFSVLEDRSLTAVFQFVLGLEDIDEKKILIYPNPSPGHLFYKTPLEGNLSILDTQGRMIQQMRIIPGTFKLDIHELYDGVYFLVFESAKGKQAIKLLKQ